MFLLERLFQNSSLPVYIVDGQMHNISVPQREDEQIPYNCDEELQKELKEASDRNGVPIIFLEELKIFHGIFSDRGGRYFIWGPACLELPDKVQLASYKHKHGITDSQFVMAKGSYDILSNIMSIAYLYYCGEQIKEEDIPIDWCDVERKYEVNPAEMEQYQLGKSEMNRIHNSIEYENKFTSAVELGDVPAMKKLLQVNSLEVEGIGVVAENATKQMEYLCVSSVLLVSRAAIRGGMNPELAYDLSDVYLQKLEKCRTSEELAFVTGKMQLDYTERVRQARSRNRGNIYVEKSKDYIANNLRKHFQIHEIAEALGVNRSYLSRIFREQEGMTIQEFLAKERCEHAANMLKFTDYSISVIAEYFCYATQSHFGKQFKKIYGMTPKEYRCENRYIDSFIKNETCTEDKI